MKSQEKETFLKPVTEIMKSCNIMAVNFQHQIMRNRFRSLGPHLVLQLLMFHSD